MSPLECHSVLHVLAARGSAEAMLRQFSIKCHARPVHRARGFSLVPICAAEQLAQLIALGAGHGPVTRKDRLESGRKVLEVDRAPRRIDENAFNEVSYLADITGP